MPLPIADAVLETRSIEFALILLFILFFKKKPFSLSLNTEITTLLKGFSVLAIIFAHIGYFLVSDTRFLFPLSIAAGVSVDLFLFLSGFGLACSAIKNPLQLKTFYHKRLLRLFVPLWLTLSIFLLLDWLFLDLAYPLKIVLQSLIGYFPKADLYAEINSPLWYFTLILGFYIIFPIIFGKRFPLLSGCILLFISYTVTRSELPVNEGVLKLYQLHFAAFPLGVIVAGLTGMLTTNQTVNSLFLKNISRIPKSAINTLRCILGTIAVYGAGHFLIHSGVGRSVSIESFISLITGSCIIAAALLLPFSNRFLLLVGTYSYELYLLHWPILYRYSPLYTRLPAGLATILSIVCLIGLAVLLRRGTERLFSFFTASNTIKKTHS